jgi:tryptophan-rich sensory protein
LSPAYVIQVPGLRQPTYLGVVSALSLSYALLFATIGAAGLAVVRHGQHQPKLLRAVAGAFATGTALALVVSVVLSFSLQTFVLAVVPMCFGLAAVPEE